LLALGDERGAGLTLVGHNGGGGGRPATLSRTIPSIEAIRRSTSANLAAATSMRLSRLVPCIVSPAEYTARLPTWTAVSWLNVPAALINAMRRVGQINERQSEPRIGRVGLPEALIAARIGQSQVDARARASAHEQRFGFGDEPRKPRPRQPGPDLPRSFLPSGCSHGRDQWAPKRMFAQ
jgi:hypothetical protein